MFSLCPPFRGGGYPVPGLWVGGVPQPDLDAGGYPPPGQVWMLGGTPLARSGCWGGTLARSGWEGYPGQVWMPRVLPPPHPLIRQSSIASTCYAAGGMPLAFTQEDFLVLILCMHTHNTFNFLNPPLSMKFVPHISLFS